MRSSSAKAARQGLLLATLFLCFPSAPAAPALPHRAHQDKNPGGFISSWPKARFPSAPEPVHSRARLAKCQNKSPPLHSWRGGRGVRSSSAGKAARSSSGSRCGHFSSQRQKIFRTQARLGVDQFPSISRDYAAKQPDFHAKIFPDGLPTAL